MANRVAPMPDMATLQMELQQREAELLQALANVAEVCGEDLFPHAPVTAALGCLQAKAFETRIAAADVLATFAERLGPSMAGVAPVGEWGGVEHALRLPVGAERCLLAQRQRP